MKGFLAGVVIMLIAFVISLRSGAASVLTRFAPGGMVNQGQASIKRQNSSGAATSAASNSCNPTADNPRFNCIPRDAGGNVGQLGGVIPDENPGLSSSGFFGK